MKEHILRALFSKEHIHDVAVLPLSECRITREDLLAESMTGGSVIMFLIPYFYGKPKNFSAYAAARDYHLYVKELSARLLPALGDAYPDASFIAFADHSPIDERHAAVRAGLGVYGKNGLVLNEHYSSYHFIGEILSDAAPERLGAGELFPIRGCEGCGACLAACPTGILRGETGADCLSAITQRKGDLTEDEARLLREQNTAWGCDVCQEVCPYTKRAAAAGTLMTEIPFFREARIESLSREALSVMDKAAFRERAFAWRGRCTVERNLRILEEKQ